MVLWTRRSASASWRSQTCVRSTARSPRRSRSRRAWRQDRGSALDWCPGRGIAGLSCGCLFGGLARRRFLGELEGVDALRLHLGFLGRLSHVHRDGDRHLGMQHYALLVETERLDRPLQYDLAAADREARLGDALRNVARRNGAVELSALAGLADDHHREPLELRCHLLGLALAREVLRLELSALGLEIGEIVLGRAQRLLLRQEEVAGVAGSHIDHLAHLAELLDPLQQNDLHHGRASLSAWRRAAGRGSAPA